MNKRRYHAHHLQAHPESGNVIWLILIAIALLGFLTAMITKSGSSVNQTGSFEQNRVKAAALIRYGKSVQNAVTQMILNGVSENDLDFDAINASYNNANCPDETCEVFNVAGGGIPYKSAATIINIPNYSRDWEVVIGNSLYGFGCDDNDISCTELLMLASEISKDMCLAINNILGIDNPNGDAPRQQDITQGTHYTGSFSTIATINVLGGTDATNESPQVFGKEAGCIYEFGSSQNKYHFFQLLVVR